MATDFAHSEIQRAQGHLAALGKEGWWPYLIDQTSYSIEATAWSLIALRHNAQVVRQSVDFLLSVQLPSGGWSTTSGVSEWDYTTYLALLAINIATASAPTSLNTPAVAAACKKARELLQDGRTEFYRPIARAVMMLWHGPTYDYPRGWPWTAKTYNWVEPTCLALLAIGTSESSDQKLLRAANNARLYLADIACVDGGWNYGNRIVLGAAVPPMAVNTCQGIIAFQAEPDGELVRKALAYLDRADGEFMSIVETAWSAIARDAIGKPFDTQRLRLARHQAADGSFAPNIMANAMATIAASIPQSGNPFKFGKS